MYIIIYYVIDLDILCTKMSINIFNLFYTDFYRQFTFHTLTSIPSYYIISQRPHDGLLLIRYVNQGEPFSHSLIAYLRRYVSESTVCRLLSGLCQGLGHWLTQTWAGNQTSGNKCYP